MNKRPAPRRTARRSDRLRAAATTIAAAGLLGVVLWAPPERAAVVATVAAPVVTAYTYRQRSNIARSSACGSSDIPAGE
ncbi:hypothetical protein GCM10009524_39450 [Spirilliplanes yamanashiensis]